MCEERKEVANMRTYAVSDFLYGNEIKSLRKKMGLTQGDFAKLVNVSQKTLFEQDINTENRQSSKGNQTKWLNGMVWYKADYTGYEGLAEYVVSALLKNTSLKETEIIHKNVLKFLQKEWYRNAVSLLNN